MFAIFLLTIRETLLQLDRELFTFIQTELSSEKIDWLFILLRNAMTWIPLYLFVLYWMYKSTGNLHGNLFSLRLWYLR
jgi:undecaprenyl-diphosphatase